MEVPVSTLRAELSHWLQRVRDGEEVVVTDRGIPVARVSPIDSAPLLERLTREGVISPPQQPGRIRATGARRVTASGSGSVSDFVGEQRR